MGPQGKELPLPGLRGISSEVHELVLGFKALSALLLFSPH